MRRLCAAAVAVAMVLALGLPAGASAHTTIIEPPGSHFPYQQWVDEAKVPTPETTLTVIEIEDPCATTAPRDGFGDLACTDGESWIYFRPNLGFHTARVTFYHELGHVWDRAVMQEWQRLRFRTLINQPALLWADSEVEATETPVDKLGWPTLGAEDWFADAYSICARQAVIQSFEEAGDGIMSKRALAATCRMIRR